MPDTSPLQPLTPVDAAFQLRPALPGDLPGAEALLTAAGLTLNDLASQWGPGFVVAEAEGGEVVGVAGVEVYGRIGLFRSAAVRADWRGMGVGAALTADRIRWARDAGLDELYLLTQTAAGYWPRFGFVPTDRARAPEALQASSEWAFACPASAVAMRRDMRGEPLATRLAT